MRPRTRLKMMSRRPLFLVSVLTGLIAASAAMAMDAAPPIMTVTVDQAKIAQFPDGTVTLVIGNPIVADVTMLKGAGSKMVVTGKGFGETNLIALDGQGNVLDEKTIRVIPTNATLLVQRGMERESYACAPQCMPTVQLGDGKVFGDASGQITARNGLMQTNAGTQTAH